MQQRGYLGYLAALIVVFLAVIVRASLEPFLHDRAPYTLFILAIGIIGWLWGRGPALLSSAISVVLVWYSLLAPYRSFDIGDTADIVQIVLYAVVSTATSLLTGSVAAYQRKLTAERDENARHRALLETVLRYVPEGITIAEGTSGNITRVSHHGLQLVQVPPDELTRPIGEHSQNWHIFRLDGTPASDEELPLTRAIRTGHITNQELWCLHRPDGSQIIVECSAAPTRDQQGKIIGGLVSYHDVTARIELEESVRRKAEELDAICDLTSVGIWISRDPECQFMFGNPAANLINHAAPDENVSATAHPDARQFYSNGRLLQPHELPLQQAAQLNREVPAVELKVVTGADTRWLWGSARPLRDVQGNSRGAVAAFLDITEMKRIQQELESKASELATALEDFQHFSHAANHDLLEPLRAVTVYSEILVERAGYASKEELSRYARYIQAGANRARILSQDLLNYSRATSQPRRDEIVHMNEVVSAVLETLHSTIEEGAATIAASELPAVLYDSSQLQQVLQNLLANALKYCSRERQPNIRVFATTEPEDCTIFVQDNGIGFDMRYAERIFGLFQRLQNAEASGSGLGLAICKRIVEQHGGKIWATSQPGQGSTFCFTIPSHRLRTAPTPAPAPAVLTKLPTPQVP